MNAYILLILLILTAGFMVYLVWKNKQLEQQLAGRDSDRTPDTVSDEVVESPPDSVRDLREQLSQFHQAMAQCPSSIIITDLDGNIEYVNAQFTEITGYTMEDVLGRNPRFLKSGNMDPDVYRDLWDTISAGTTWRGDLENRTHEGRLFWEHVSIAPIRDAGGTVTRYFAVKEDITEAHLREDEARQARLEAEAAEAADQAKGIFLRVMSQEMKNPLNRVLGFTNLLSQSNLSNEQLRQLNQVGGAGLELLALIDRVLDFTSAETGMIELRLEPFKPSEVVDQLLRQYGEKAAERNLMLHPEISESIPDYVIGDEKRFREVLAPLLDNAVKFTPEGSVRVRLSAHYNEANEIWEFRGEVIDTGIGIPEERLIELFKPFTQLEPGVGEGAGLGLALCQRLCQLQGGLLSARSELGKGSTFSFELKLRPMETDDAAVQVARGPDGRQFAQAYPIEILVAEDNRINRRLLETLMDRLGYKASFALDGVSVMSEVRKRPYDLILMDLQMPNVGGIEAARRIRSGEAGSRAKDVRIVAITAFTSDENLQASREVGMDAFLAKPFDIAKIKREIIHAYDSKMARKV